jgi:hypothetical protein
MLDIPDLILDEAADPSSISVSRPEARDTSPLRPWSMWGGVSAVGLVCAVGVAHAVALVGRTVSAR